MSMWTGTIIEDENGGAVVGDIATGFAAMVEWTLPDVPTARASTYYAVTADGEGADARYAVAEVTEFLVGTDPTDLPGTEVFCDYEYGEGSYLNYGTEDEARTEARRLAAGELVNGSLTWNGTSTR